MTLSGRSHIAHALRHRCRTAVFSVSRLFDPHRVRVRRAPCTMCRIATITYHRRIYHVREHALIFTGAAVRVASEYLRNEQNVCQTWINYGLDNILGGQVACWRAGMDIFRYLYKRGSQDLALCKRQCELSTAGGMGTYGDG